MELRIFFKLIKRYWLGIFLITLSTTIGAVGFSLKKPVGYDVAVGVVTGYENNQKENNAFYQFDGFYASQAAERFSQVILGVLKSASTTKEIYDTAGIPLEDVSIKALSQVFKPQKRTERVIEVNYSAPNPEEAEKLGKALATVMNIQAEIETKGSKEGSFKVLTSPPVILKASPNTFIWAFLGMAGGLFLALSIVLAVAYFRAGAEEVKRV